MSPSPRPDRIALVDQIEDLLPQTQCTKCGTAGCRPYAEAVAAGTPHNRCVPGGAETIAELSALLSLPPLPLDPAFGVEPATRRVAFIREAECIGCTKCLQACPVDAIVGAAKLMHTVITDECTGCDLCIPPCPVDCIDMHELPKITEPAAKKAAAAQYRQRFEARRERLAAQAAASAPPSLLPNMPGTAATTITLPPATDSATQSHADATANTAKPAASDDKARVIAAALARTQLKKAEKRLASARDNGEALDALMAEVEKLQADVTRLS